MKSDASEYSGDADEKAVDYIKNVFWLLTVLCYYLGYRVGQSRC